MFIRATLIAACATALISTAALAAATAGKENHPASRPQMADRCAVLESQYDSVISDHQNATKFQSAMDLHAVGATQCNANQGDLGARKLEQALIDLGVKPAA